MEVTNMNYTQNDKINQIKNTTLVVGIDIAKYDHVARCIDDRGRDLDKHLEFSNSFEGFEVLIEWIEKNNVKHGKSDVIIGMEPTGHYWFNIANYLKAKDIKVVVVNPMHVKKTKEIDDNSPTKNDIKDARVIAKLVKDGSYSIPIIPEGVFSELRIAMDIKSDIDNKLNIIKNRIIRWTDMYFPEFFEVFSDLKGKTAIMTLKEFALPSQILELGELNVLQQWRREIQKGVGIKKATLLVEKAKDSIGLKQGLDLADYQIKFLIEEYRFYIKTMNDLVIKIEKLLQEIPYTEYLLDIKGIGVMTVAGILAETGDLRNYSHPNQIIKLAGLNLKENSSGTHKGKTTISKRGRAKLRSVLFKCIMPMASKNPEFKLLHDNFVNRPNNPLKKMQSLIALCGKLIKIIFAIATKALAYNPTKVVSNLNILETQQKAA